MGVALLLPGAAIEGIRAYPAPVDTRASVAAEKTTLHARIPPVLHTNSRVRCGLSQDMDVQQHDPLSHLCNQPSRAPCACNHDSSSVVAVDVCVPSHRNGVGRDAPDCPRGGHSAVPDCDSDVAVHISDV